MFPKSHTSGFHSSVPWMLTAMPSRIPILEEPFCVVLGKPVHFTEPHISHLCNEKSWIGGTLRTPPHPESGEDLYSTPCLRKPLRARICVCVVLDISQSTFKELTSFGTSPSISGIPSPRQSSCKERAMRQQEAEAWCSARSEHRLGHRGLVPSGCRSFHLLMLLGATSPRSGPGARPSPAPRPSQCPGRRWQSCRGTQWAGHRCPSQEPLPQEPQVSRGHRNPLWRRSVLM